MIGVLRAAAGLTAVIVAWGSAIAQTDPAPLAPSVYASPIHAGCLLTGRNRCVVHVEPLTISVASGKALVAYQVLLNWTVVYDFRTDSSNPPVGDYSPTLVKRDFAAYCGRSYAVQLYGRDTGDPSFYVLGQTNQFQCPSCGATAPSNVAGLALAGDHKTLTWTPQQPGTTYSVVKGDLPSLLRSGGSFMSSLTGCLLPDSLTASATDPASPGIRGGFYYLVRARNCSGDTGSYDEDGAGLYASRDASIGASSYRCP